MRISKIFDIVSRFRRLDVVDNDKRLPEDMIMEILLRLRPSSVVRFKCVCKEWYSLISNPDFLHAHSSPFQLQQQCRTSNVDDLVLAVFSTNVKLFPLNLFEEKEDVEHYPKQAFRLIYKPLPYSYGRYDFVDSCNGLFLFNHLTVKEVDDNIVTYPCEYYLCNLITEHYFKLPNMNIIPKIEQQHANIVFHPSISLSYKVITYVLPQRQDRDRDRHWKIYVYSSETGIWRLLSTTIPYYPMVIHFCYRTVLLNGVLYWTHLNTIENVSICFDVEKECVHNLPLPRIPENSMRSCIYIGECGGRLRLIERYLDLNEPDWEGYSYILPCYFDIMEMELKKQQEQDSFHCTWIVKYHVDITQVYDFLSGQMDPVIHFCRRKNKRGNARQEEEEVLLLKLNDKSIAVFNLTSMVFKKIIEHSERTPLTTLSDALVFNPILFPFS